MLALSITLLAFNLKIMYPNNMAFGPQKMQKYGSKYSLQLAFCLGLTITITYYMAYLFTAHSEVGGEFDIFCALLYAY